VSATRDDGRNLTGARLTSYYRAVAGSMIRSEPARLEPGRLTISGAIVTDKRQAYALAFEIMSMADHTFKGETL
jgi:hypothetical protein